VAFFVGGWFVGGVVGFFGIVMCAFWYHGCLVLWLFVSLWLCFSKSLTLGWGGLRVKFIGFFAYCWVFGTDCSHKLDVRVKESQTVHLGSYKT